MGIRCIIAGFMIVFLFTGQLSAQISPGDLSKAHAELEGVSHCTQCHSVGNKVTRQNCLACHKEIQKNIEQKKGYHASNEVATKECFECHNEHHGRNFQIIRFDKDTFNHSKSGFELKGTHSKQDCKACHKPEFVKDVELKKKTTTYLGLNSECLTCHADYHQGKMSDNCSECHSFESFKNAKAFDHNTTKFPLVGKHKSLDCKQCHKTEIVNGKSAQQFSGLVFENCTGCHTDVHKNKFGQNCKECHTEESFHQIKGLKDFDHDRTDFKLVGKHKTVDCKSCHKTNMTDPIKFDRCSNCHDDYHKNEFEKNGVSPDCNQCHTNESFIESTYSIEQHNKTKFKLEGAHLATPCFECHKKKEERWTFSKMGEKCVDCHKNEHKGFIQEKYYPDENCTLCHSIESWKKVDFDHNKTNFKLEGAHSKQTCNECHYKKNDRGVKTQLFKGISTNCSACHKDSHVGQFEVNGKTDCTTCHGFDDFKKSMYDHNTSRFKLEGAHLKVKCEECHKTVENAKGKYIRYKFENIECSNCHH